MPADSDDDPDVKDYGEPAASDLETDPPSGTSGAEDGVSPLSPEQYDSDEQE
jgi:hypothetical protein